MAGPTRGMSRGDMQHKQLARAAQGKPKPNRHSIAVRPHKYKQPSKAEMQADLKKAVENTK